MLKVLAPSIVLLLMGLLFGGALPAAEPEASSLPDAAEALQAPALVKFPEEDEKAFNEFELGDFLEITAHGDLWLYHIRTTNTYHTDDNAAFTEMTARLGADFAFKDAEWLTAQYRALTHGN